MKLDRIPIADPRAPELGATLVVQGRAVRAEDGATLPPARLGAVVAFLTTARPVELLGAAPEGALDGFTVANRAPVDSPADLASSLTELEGLFGVVPDWSALAEASDLVELAP